MAKKTHDNYSNVYQNQFGFGKPPALILIDFVEAYFNKKCELYADIDDALASAIRVRNAARDANIPTIYTNVVYHKTAINGGRFFKKAKPLKHFIDGSVMGAWPANIKPADDELVISKQYPRAFFGTSLASTLTALGVDSLIITGLTTSGCVRETCVDACSHGFIPIVVANACGDRHPDPHVANVFDMSAKYADVVSETQSIDYLTNLKL